MDPLWNEDGTARLPDTVRRADGTPFADLATAEERDAYVNYAKLRAEAMANQPAGLGDIVHVWGAHNNACYAAMVTEPALFEGEEDGLAVFEPGATAVTPIVAVHDEGKTPSTWHWPEPQ